jgi:lysophospholipase
MSLVSIAANPVPEGAVSGTFKAADGRELRFGRFPPPPGRKGTVCLFQGRTEFIEKYFEVVRDLQARGFAVATLDWRGQGLSQRALADRRKGHVRDFSEYDADLDAFMKHIVLPDCPPPFFALGHSMGAAILTRALAKGRRWFDRSVLASPMLALQVPGSLRTAKTIARSMQLLGMGTAYLPGGGATAMNSLPFPGNPLTSDPVRYARAAATVEAEPALGLGSPTVGWINAAFRATHAFADPGYPSSMRQPLLIIAAGQDRVVSTPAIEQFAIRLRAGSHLVVPGARHELLMEQDRFRGQFWAAFDAFIPGSPLFA